MLRGIYFISSFDTMNNAVINIFVYVSLFTGIDPQE